MEEQDKRNEAMKKWGELSPLAGTGDASYTSSEGRIFLKPEAVEKARKSAENHEEMHREGRSRTLHAIVRALGSSHIPLPPKFLAEDEPQPPTEEERRMYRGLFKDEG